MPIILFLYVKSCRTPAISRTFVRVCIKKEGRPVFNIVGTRSMVQIKRVVDGTRRTRIGGTRRHNNKGSAHCDHLFIPKCTADARCRATRSDRRGIYRYPKYIHFHFGHYAQVEERVRLVRRGGDRHGDPGRRERHHRQRQGITKSQ